MTYSYSSNSNKYAEEMSELAEIYKDKLEESFNEEGFPKTISFEDEDGEVITYIREDEYDDWYEEEYV